MNNKPLHTPDLENKCILIVEDDLNSHELFLIVLRKTKAVIISAYDGMDAIKMVKDYAQIDLVLMDLKMPILSGFDATKQIKKIRPNLTVIAQSAHALLGDKEKALQAGCDDFLTKPIKKDVLFELLSRYLVK